ncbi:MULTISPECIES: aromatic acid exporter family protein [unclassified Cytobacillus]|uniref:aromatic acid exporter family protein n=1 Tax=unclassified Cytobacillus TaxID=2675268 RepID=UPI00135AE9B2|nr:aromatic acid exporter family protein [Cytobacillus sp. AMY 15.2]KAF0819925.1 Integral membrane protein [Bacillus sp. ZZV12-4809]MCM3093222.1 aromatic acid exporter family protein [Cytobacillus sp. AMY 15.2]
MKQTIPYTFIGGRIAKTGLAVFITAFICHMLKWPAMFAVITAIVTIEPTVADSIRKAYVRFPAAAIGAGFAVLFTFIFGDSPYSYASVSLATIIACHKLKLQDGMLVATLTGVAMISTVQDHYLSSFFIRLGTTSTGIVVSTAVNLLVMPPDYSKSIMKNIQALYRRSGDILFKRGHEVFNMLESNGTARADFQSLIKDIDKTETLCHYQKSEYRFHRFSREDMREFHYEYKKLTILKQISYHIGNLVFLPPGRPDMESERKNLAASVLEDLKNRLYEPDFLITDSHYKKISEVTQWFFEQKQQNPGAGLKPRTHHHVQPETAILYEILSIHDLIEELNQIQTMEVKNRRILKTPWKQGEGE